MSASERASERTRESLAHSQAKFHSLESPLLLSPSLRRFAVRAASARARTTQTALCVCTALRVLLSAHSTARRAIASLFVIAAHSFESAAAAAACETRSALARSRRRRRHCSRCSRSRAERTARRASPRRTALPMRARLMRFRTAYRTSAQALRKSVARACKRRTRPIKCLAKAALSLFLNPRAAHTQAAAVVAVSVSIPMDTETTATAAAMAERCESVRATVLQRCAQIKSIGTLLLLLLL